MSEKLIPLRRVVLQENIDRPRNERDASESTDKVFERYPKNSSKQVLLWLSQDGRFVYIDHPTSKEREEVPVSFVRQLQRLTDLHIEIAKNPPPPPGLRHSLDAPKPDPGTNLR